MWPWGHLALAYLTYALYARLDSTRRQTAATLGALAVGSQFPDLVDKPLAWTFGVLPSGRSLAHSLLTIAVVLLVLYRVAAWYRRTEEVTAFGIGAVVHALSDLPPTLPGSLLAGDLTQLQWARFLAWPLLPSPPYANDASFTQQFSTLSFDPYVQFQFALLALAVLVWLAEGAPGFASVTRRGKAALADRL